MLEMAAGNINMIIKSNRMTPQYLGYKDLLNRKLTAFLASRTVQTERVLACYDWATGLCAETIGNGIIGV